jgi:ankyrin repeat protein
MKIKFFVMHIVFLFAFFSVPSVLSRPQDFGNFSYDIKIENAVEVKFVYGDIYTNTLAARIKRKENGKEVFYIQYNNSLFGPYHYIHFDSPVKKATDNLCYFIAEDENEKKTLVLTDGRTFFGYDAIDRIRLSDDGRKIIYAYRKGETWYIYANNRHYGPYEPDRYATESSAPLYFDLYVDNRKTIFYHPKNNIAHLNINGTDYPSSQDGLRYASENILGYIIFKEGKLPGFKAGKMWHLVIQSKKYNLDIDKPIGYHIKTSGGFELKRQFDVRFRAGRFGYGYIEYIDDREYMNINGKSYGPYDQVGPLHLCKGEGNELIPYFVYKKSGVWSLWIDGDSNKIINQSNIKIMDLNFSKEKYMTDRSILNDPRIYSYTEKDKIISYNIGESLEYKHILSITGKQYGPYYNFYYDESSEYPGHYYYMYSKQKDGPKYITINNKTYGPYERISEITFNNKYSWAFIADTDPNSEKQYIITNSKKYGPYSNVSISYYENNDLIYRYQNPDTETAMFQVTRFGDKVYAYSRFNRYNRKIGYLFDSYYDQRPYRYGYIYSNLQVNDRIYHFDDYWYGMTVADDTLFLSFLSKDGKKMYYTEFDSSQKSEHIMLAHAKKKQDDRAKIRSIIYCFDSLIKSGYDIDTADENGATSLMWAAARGNVELVRYLVENNAELYPEGIIWINKERNAYFGGVLPAAVYTGNMDVVRYLVEEAGVDINKGEFDYERNTFSTVSPIFFGVDNGNMDLFAYLHQHGADLDRTFTLSEFEYTLLDYALIANSSHNEDILFYLRRHGVGYNLTDNDALLNAAWKGFFKFAKNIIENKGADINYATEAGFSILHMAVYHGSYDFVKYLVDAGADTDVTCPFGDGSVMTPLQQAQSVMDNGTGNEEYEKIITYLKSKGAR